MWRYHWYRWKEKLQMWVAWKLPRWLVMWAAVRLGAEATTTGGYVGTVPDMRFMDALKRWG